MKLQNKTSRLTLQTVVVAGLIFIPVSTIIYRGADAMSIILSLRSEDAVTTEPEGALESPDSRSRNNRSGIKFGVYDPQEELGANQNIRIQHTYISWIDFDENELLKLLANSHRGDSEHYLTIEPWPRKDAKGALFDDVLAGKYDSSIVKLRKILDRANHTTYVAWGHEMDQDLVERYPWSGQRPERFIAAYRYVMAGLGAKDNDMLKCVWNGVIKSDSASYWPGDAWVDYIGLPIYSFPAWETQHYGYIRSFNETFEEKWKLVKELDKPLIISEMGVSGSSDFESYWLRQAFLEFDNYPQIDSVIFFYARDTDGAWGRDIPTPDWRVHPEAIQALVDWYTDNKTSS